MQRTCSALSRNPCRLKQDGWNNFKQSPQQPGCGLPPCLLLRGALSTFSGSQSHQHTVTLPTGKLTGWPLLSSHRHLMMLPAQHLPIFSLTARWTQELGVQLLIFFFSFYRNFPHYGPDSAPFSKRPLLP